MPFFCILKGLSQKLFFMSYTVYRISRAHYSQSINHSTCCQCNVASFTMLCNLAYVKKGKLTSLWWNKPQFYKVDLVELVKEARKGFLTTRRMDLKIHASKLPTRKTRKAARELKTIISAQ